MCRISRCCIRAWSSDSVALAVFCISGLAAVRGDSILPPFWQCSLPRYAGLVSFLLSSECPQRTWDLGRIHPELIPNPESQVTLGRSLLSRNCALIFGFAPFHQKSTCLICGFWWCEYVSP